MSIAIPVNFRDLGGMPGAANKRVVKGRLYRGGQLFTLTTAQKQTFCAAKDIRLLIDLRNEDSCLRAPNGTIPGVAQRVFEVMANLDELSQDQQKRYTSAAAAEDFLARMYVALVKNPHANACFREILTLIASLPTGGVYFHCYAGKDRTGIVAAVLLTALGVCKEDVFSDYMRSAEGRRAENRRILGEARAAGQSDDALGAIETLLNVKPRYLNGAFEAAESAYGSFDRYIRTGIGVNDEIITTLRKKYLT